jgi:carbamoyltransferase
MNILGISNLDNSSTALLGDGEIIAACEEERFTRVKHQQAFPVNAIQQCLDIAGIGISNIDHVAIGWIPYSGIIHRVVTSINLAVKQRSWGKKSKRGAGYLGIVREQILTAKIIGEKFGRPVPKVHYINHHDAHAACAFFLSPFNDAAYLTIDGTGEYQTCTMGGFFNGRMKKIYQNRFPDSLGHLYSIFTSFLGFKPNSDEGKVMGLAAYGDSTYSDIIQSMIKFDSFTCKFCIDSEYFDYAASLAGCFPRKFISRFGKPRKPGGRLETRHKDIAAGIQLAIENSVLRLVEYLHQNVESENLCMSGGVALNCVANAKIKEKDIFKRIYVPSAASDAGVSLGAALYLYHIIMENRQRKNSGPPFWGPDHSSEYLPFLLQKGVRYKISSDPEKAAAEYLAKGKIIGWFQGGMEFGPRALGARSILAPPYPGSMKDIINRRIKFRESFRPFAPIILEEDIPKWFNEYCDSPNMSFAFQVQEHLRDRIPAVTHVDGRARLQTVNMNNCPCLYRLLKNIKEKTGIPILLNTSFNSRGEPIVENPENAWDCFTRSEMDYLFLGNYIIDRTSM